MSMRRSGSRTKPRANARPGLPDRQALVTEAAGSLAVARATRWAMTIDRRRLVAVLGALVVGVVVASALARASATVEALGTTRTVLVATGRIEPGEPLTVANTELAARPAGHLPDHSLTERPSDAIASATIEPGEVVVEARVVGHPDGGSDRRGSGSVRETMLAIDERAVTIPMPFAPPPVRLGVVVDIVGIVAADGPFGATATPLGTGRVVFVGEDAITIATTSVEAMAVVSHLGSGAVELLITPFERAGPPLP